MTQIVDSGATTSQLDAIIAAGNYRVVESLGKGGMGEVFAVMHTVLKRRYAMKVIHSRYARDPRFVDRMRIEARPPRACVTKMSSTSLISGSTATAARSSSWSC